MQRPYVFASLPPFPLPPSLPPPPLPFPLLPSPPLSRTLPRLIAASRPFPAHQILQYFNFLCAILINNAVLAVWSLIAWAPHAANVW